MSEVDLVALNKANRGLVVCFIISIFIINCLLIFKTVKRGGFLYNAKCLTVISLAIGDIFLALFSLVVQAIFYYQADTYDPACRTFTAYQVYMNFLIHFVFGVGLIVLAVDLVYRYKRQPPVKKSMNNFVKAAVCSAVPWFLGLIIVLPLTMAGTLYQGCLLFVEPSRQEAMYGVSVLLPACLALIVCIIVMCIRLFPSSFTMQTVNYPSSTPGVVITTHTTTSGHQQYLMNGVVPTQQMSTVPPATYYNHIDNHNPQFAGQYVIAPNTQYMPPQPIAQPNIVNGNPVYSVQPQTTSSAVQYASREKNVLLTISIVYLVCVVPFAGFKMGTSDILHQIVLAPVDTAFSTALFWLSIFRSVITPVIWMGCSRN